jgi:murein DD-endopeptidase MepM/ murein hydrolase activator NlpD
MNIHSTVLVLCCALAGGASWGEDSLFRSVPSQGAYRLPYENGTRVKVFDDFTTHRPAGRIDLLGMEGRQHRIVAAAPGRVVAIQDTHGEQQPGRTAAECRNNYVWLEHANGEWTNYSHLAEGSVTQRARLSVGDTVKAGDYLGDEAAVGCAMLVHLHFEVAVPDEESPIDGAGFLRDNDGGKRERNPRFCGIDGGTVVKGVTYEAVPCSGATPSPH